MRKKWKLVFGICIAIAAVAILAGCCGLFGGGKNESAYPVKVDYYMSLDDMVRAGGYGIVDLGPPHPPSRVKSFQEEGNYGGLVGNAYDVLEYVSWRIIVGDPANHAKVVEEVPLDLVHFTNGVAPSAVRVELSKLGYRPATVAELLAFGARYPDEQKKYPIAALGTEWQGSGDTTYVATIGCKLSNRDIRSLNLCETSGFWDAKWYFLVAPNN